MTEPVTERTTADQMYPGFTIKHDKCPDAEVWIDSSLGYSAMSGGWGDVRLVCQVCGYYVVVVDA
jgi:hypothetical protein